jgi:hypothetical protein
VSETLAEWNERTRHLTPASLTQTCAYPTFLHDLVTRCSYKGWSIVLEEDLDRGQGSKGTTLVITSCTEDSYAEPPGDEAETVCGRSHPSLINVRHFFIVPAGAYDEFEWRRWLFDCCVAVELHEAMEMFKIDGTRPYAPHHGPGRNPYILHERGSDEQANTDQRGNPAYRPA